MSLARTSSEPPPLVARHILGTRVHATSYADATDRILRWAKAGESRYVCVSTVHMVMEGYDDESFRDVVTSADLVTPDGMPLVWALRMLGVDSAQRTYGPVLTPAVCERAAREHIPVGFLGGAPRVLEKLLAEMSRRFPTLSIAYAASPPFRNMTVAEEHRMTEEINASGARILFVGLGCPKQEQWMGRHRGVVQAVMIGVGAAFDFLAGEKRQAPRVMQDTGLEWLFRLSHEPRRLWRRYVYHNPRYVVLFARQLVKRSNDKRTGDRATVVESVE